MGENAQPGRFSGPPLGTAGAHAEQRAQLARAAYTVNRLRFVCQRCGWRSYVPESAAISYCIFCAQSARAALTARAAAARRNRR